MFKGISNVGTQAEQTQIFRNAAQHLAPGGRFVIELWVRGLPHPAVPQAAAVGLAPGYMVVDRFDAVAQQVVSHHFRFDEGQAPQLFASPHRTALSGRRSWI